MRFEIDLNLFHLTLFLGLAQLLLGTGCASDYYLQRVVEIENETAIGDPSDTGPEPTPPAFVTPDDNPDFPEPTEDPEDPADEPFNPFDFDCSEPFNYEVPGFGGGIYEVRSFPIVMLSSPDLSEIEQGEPTTLEFTIMAICGPVTFEGGSIGMYQGNESTWIADVDDQQIAMPLTVNSGDPAEKIGYTPNHNPGSQMFWSYFEGLNMPFENVTIPAFQSRSVSFTFTASEYAPIGEIFTLFVEHINWTDSTGVSVWPDFNPHMDVFYPWIVESNFEVVPPADGIVIDLGPGAPIDGTVLTSTGSNIYQGAFTVTSYGEDRTLYNISLCTDGTMPWHHTQYVSLGYWHTDGVMVTDLGTIHTDGCAYFGISSLLPEGVPVEFTPIVDLNDSVLPGETLQLGLTSDWFNAVGNSTGIALTENNVFQEAWAGEMVYQ